MRKLLRSMAKAEMVRRGYSKGEPQNEPFLRRVAGRHRRLSHQPGDR